MASIIFGCFVVLSIVLAIWAKLSGSTKSSHDFFVASGQFGARLVFILTAGEVYSIGSMVGFPGGIYAKGITYGVWFMGYTLLAYPIGYFIGPKLWEAGKQFKAITMPDLFKGYFSSRAVELVVAVTTIICMLPSGQLQFSGIIIALRALGWDFDPMLLAACAASLLFLYIVIAGIRASAIISIQKDILMIAAVVITGVAVIMKSGISPVFQVAVTATNKTFNIHQQTFAMTTMLYQSMGFYCIPFALQSFFTAKDADSIRKCQMAMPLYMFMYPFLVLASYYAVSAQLKLHSANDAFFAAATRLLPPWLLGLVGAGACLAGLMTLAGTSLAMGPIVMRNIFPCMPESRQKAGAKAVIGTYLLVSIFMAVHSSSLMVTLNNMTYFGITQFFPGLVVIAMRLKTKGGAIATGILTGQITTTILYFCSVNLAGINLGLIGLIVNLLTLFVVNASLPVALLRKPNLKAERSL